MRKMALIPKLLIFILIILFLLVAIYLFREKILVMVAEYLVLRDDLSQSDVIHVIAGEDYRTEYAIELYKKGFARYIFFTGGWCKYHNINHGEHGMELARRQGVPVEAIIIDDSNVTSTFSEVELLKSWMDKNPYSISSVIVVSDPFHMRRAKWIYKFILGRKIKLVMAPVPIDRTPYKQNWWGDQASFRFVRDEYFKLVYYFFRYQLSIKWLEILDTK